MIVNHQCLVFVMILVIVLYCNVNTYYKSISIVHNLSEDFLFQANIMLLNASILVIYIHLTSKSNYFDRSKSHGSDLLDNSSFDGMLSK